MSDKKYGKYTVEFEDSYDEDGDHAFATITFLGDVNVPDEILTQMVTAADKCGTTHKWEIQESCQFEDESKRYEWHENGEIACTEYILHRMN